MPAYHGSAKKIGNSNIVWTKAPCDSKNKIKKARKLAFGRFLSAR